MKKLLVLPEEKDASSLYQVNPVLCLSKNQTMELDFLLGEDFFLTLKKVQDKPISNQKINVLQELRHEIEDILYPLCREYKKEYRNKKNDSEYTSKLLDDLTNSKKLVRYFLRSFNQYVSSERKMLEKKRREEKRKQTDLDSFLILINPKDSTVRRFFNLSKEQMDICKMMQQLDIPEICSEEDFHNYILALSFHIKDYQEKGIEKFYDDNNFLLSTLNKPWILEEEEELYQQILNALNQSTIPLFNQKIKISNPKYMTYLSERDIEKLLSVRNAQLQCQEENIKDSYLQLEFRHFQRLFLNLQEKFSEYEQLEGTNLDDFYLIKDVLRQKAVHFHKKSVVRSYFQQFGKSLGSIEDEKVFYEIESITAKKERIEFQTKYRKLVLEDKSYIDVQGLLREDRKLLTLKSENQEKRLFFYDILDRYFNLLLNAKIDHPDIDYFSQIVALYLREMDFRKEKRMLKTAYGKMEKFLFTLSQSDFDPSRIQHSFTILLNVAPKERKSKKAPVAKTPFSRIEKEDTLIHKNANQHIFTIDKEGTKVFDQALSFEKSEKGSHLGIYIADVTSVSSRMSEVCKNGFEKRKLLGRDKTNEISLKEGKSGDVIGFHFEFDHDQNLTNFYAKKERINVRKNFIFKDGKGDNNTSLVFDNIPEYLEETIGDFRGFMKTLPVSIPEKIVGDNEGRKITSKVMTYFNRTITEYCNKKNIPIIQKYIYDNGQDGNNKGYLSEFSAHYNSSDTLLQKKVKQLEKLYSSGFYYTDPKLVKTKLRQATFSCPLRDLTAFFNFHMFNEYYFHENSINQATRIDDSYQLSRIALKLNERFKVDGTSLETSKRKNRADRKVKMKSQDSHKQSSISIEASGEDDKDMDIEYIKVLKSRLAELPKWN